MKVLILGVTGMLGHKLYQVLTPNFNVAATSRGSYSDISKYGLFQESNILSEVNVLEISRVEEVINQINPDVVVNCIGIIKQVQQVRDRLLSVWINSLFPHQLYKICEPRGIRLIHISTDCVFSGDKGNYIEDDPSDAKDIYGKTKYLGEVSGNGALTIRTSIIGRELSTSNGIVEWFIANKAGKVNGFSRAIFTGFPTVHLAQIIGDVIANQRDLNGIYHVASDPIDKFTLLNLINDRMGLGIEIKESQDFRCDRSLDSALFRNKTGFKPHSWEKMTSDLAQDAKQYLKWRS